MKPTKSCILTLFLLFAALAASAQADRKIEQQKRVIAARSAYGVWPVR